MPAPKFNTPEGPPQCPRCGGPTRYQERHRKDGVWVHQRCEATPGSLPYLLDVVEELDLDDPAQCCVQFLVWTMFSQGKLVRVRK